MDDFSLLKKLVYQGLAKKIDNATDLFLDRLSLELDSIQKSNNSEYFLLSANIADVCNNLGFLRSPGRGSSASSLVNYCLDITKINPLEEDLIFERFFNLSRTRVADIDIDIAQGCTDNLFIELKRRLPNCDINQELSQINGSQFDIFERPFLSILNRISKQLKSEFHPYNIDLTDSAVFDFIIENDLSNIFLLENNSFAKVVKNFEPESISDLSIMNSLFLPKSLKEIDKITQNKLCGYDMEFRNDNRVNILLEETYGMIVYQETFMHLANQIAGMDMNLADIYRRVFVKNNDAEKIKQFENDFKKGCIDNSNLSGLEIEKLMAMILKSAPISFNKSYAISYTIFAYWGAYYKTHFRKEFDECFSTKEKPEVAF